MIKWILRVNFFKKLKNNMRENIDLNSQIFIFVSLRILKLCKSVKSAENQDIIPRARNKSDLPWSLWIPYL